jgi:hypothetical protein
MRLALFPPSREPRHPNESTLQFLRKRRRTAHGQSPRASATSTAIAKIAVKSHSERSHAVRMTGRYLAQTHDAQEASRRDSM